MPGMANKPTVMCTPFTCDYECALQGNLSSICLLQLTHSLPYLLPLILCISYGTFHIAGNLAFFPCLHLAVRKALKGFNNQSEDLNKKIT